MRFQGPAVYPALSMGTSRIIGTGRSWWVLEQAQDRFAEPRATVLDSPFGMLGTASGRTARFGFGGELRGSFRLSRGA